MALKSWEEMRKIDVTPYCQERDGMTYLNWAKCIDLLHENGAKKVYWVPIPDEVLCAWFQKISQIVKEIQIDVMRHELKL